MTPTIASLIRRALALVAGDVEFARLLARAAEELGVGDDARALARSFLGPACEETPHAVEAGRPAPPEVADETAPGTLDSRIPGPVPSATPTLVASTGPEPPREAAIAPRVEEEPRTAPPREPLPKLTLGLSRPAAEAAARPSADSAADSSSDEGEIEAIAAHCRLKAQGARWAAERRSLLDDGADFRVEIAPTDNELLGRAREAGDCYLWMNVPGYDIPDDLALLRSAADAFDAVAEAAALIVRLDLAGDRDQYAFALDLLAEAQSALRIAVEQAGGPRDQDQWRAYNWLRETTAVRKIYVRRHMRLEDPADPAALSVLRAKVAAVDAGVRRADKKSKLRKSRINGLCYHARLIRERGAAGDSSYDWRRVAEIVGAMVDEGVPPSNLEIREALLPILEDLPDLGEVPKGFDLALREIDRYLALVELEPDDASRERAPSPQVEAAAGLLAGKSVLLIGGIRRPHAHEAIRRAFGLAELIWFETKEHESIAVFEPYVKRPEVALVLVAIRWSSHSFGDVKRYCDAYDKPLVYLPAGYSPNQVAAQVLAQSSGHLSAEPSEASGIRP